MAKGANNFHHSQERIRIYYCFVVHNACYFKIQNTLKSVSTIGAAPSVSQVANLFPPSAFSLLPLCSSGRGQPGSVPEAKSRITEGRALVIPVPRGSRDAAVVEIRGVILIYEGNTKAEEECSDLISIFW